MKKIFSLIISASVCLSSFTASAYAYRLGDNADIIADAQHSLSQNGYIIKDTKGYFGLSTLSAIIDFQDENNIYISGTIDDETKKLLTTSDNTTIYNEEDLYWLSRIVYAESRGESYEGKLAVANCVLNRVKSSIYPNTVYGVIFDRNYGVQYQPVANGTIYNTPDEDSIKAAKEALGGKNIIGECLFFFNPVTAQNFWISENREYYTTIGNHAFYL